jgi:protein-disulfide isomerase
MIIKLFERCSRTKYLKTILAIITFCSLTLIAQEKSNSIPKVVASIQGAAVTIDDLNNAAAAELEKLDLQRMQLEAKLEQTRYEILNSTLQRMIKDKVFKAETSKRGITLEELISLEVTGKLKDPTDQEIDSYYEANKARIGPEKGPAIDQIKQLLRRRNQAQETEAYLESLKKSYEVVSNLAPFRFTIETKGHPSKGPDSVPITLVEFSDFQCSYCQTMASTLRRVLDNFGDKVRIVFRQYPNPRIHPFSQKAAEASLCALDQGRFWEMHDLMFQDPEHLSPEDLKNLAAKLGLSKDVFESCLDSGRYEARIKKDFTDAIRAGVEGTPSLFINGRLFTGARPYEEITDLIQNELKSKQTGSSQKN